MTQSNIIITQTYINYNVIRMLLGLLFNDSNDIVKSIEDLEKIETTKELYNILNEDLDLKQIEGKYESLLSSQKIIEHDYTDKKQFTKQILDLYSVYSKPTLLFLGSLDNYSIQLQEGMLKLLEEPPNNLIIVLFSKTQNIILPTIKSRSNIYQISKKLVMKNLDQELLEKTKKNLPEPLKFVKQLIKDKTKVEFPDLKKVEREEIDFWLWQLLNYLESFYKQNRDQRIAKLLNKVLESQKLNSKNLQKKFVLNWLKN